MRTALLTISLLLTLVSALPATAQTAKPAPRPPARAASRPATAPKPSASAEATSPAQLPVTRVSLYKNGVGFFEHAGRISGDQAVTIDFTTAQLNDVLQSLTAVDLNGGRIAGADYNSTTPLEQQLSALPFSLGQYATAADFYNAIRGARVSVTGSSAAIAGRLLDIEVTNIPASGSQPGSQKRLLTVAGDDGTVRTVELTSATSVRLLDPQLESNLTQFLKVLDANRSDGLRHLTLQDLGSGARELHVSYLSEVPIWKSTYRILFTDHTAGSTPPAQPSGVQTATLQGWSVVDNTTGADWINVHLSLIAGAPQSFIQPLSVPYYSRRPEIGLPQEAQLSPQTHESGEFDPNTAAAKASGQQGQINGLAGFSGADVQNRIAQLQARATGPMAGGVMGGLGAATGSGLGTVSGGALRRVGGGVPAAAALDALSLDGRPIDGQLYQSLAANSTAANSSTSAFDDYFAYNLTDPITIRRNESALVPILQTKIDAERVTLWSLQQPVPLRALWVTNTSDLTLDRGSFTIVENGDFGGEGLLDPIHPGEKRLLSYAVDQAVRVTTSNRTPDTRITEFIVANGWLRQISSDSRSVEYTVHNAAAEPRTVVIERPLSNGWDLAPTSAKPEETTSTVNRYRAVASAGGTAIVHIDETHLHDQNWHLIETDDAQFNIILHNAQPSPQLIAQLQPVIDARKHVADMQKALDDANNRMNELGSDEERQRSNVTALANADKASRDRFVHDLNATEDQIAVQQKTINAAQANLQSAKDDLTAKIASLSLDLKL